MRNLAPLQVGGHSYPCVSNIGGVPVEESGQSLLCNAAGPVSDSGLSGLCIQHSVNGQPAGISPVCHGCSCRGLPCCCPRDRASVCMLSVRSGPMGRSIPTAQKTTLTQESAENGFTVGLSRVQSQLPSSAPSLVLAKGLELLYSDLLNQCVPYGLSQKKVSVRV